MRSITGESSGARTLRGLRVLRDLLEAGRLPRDDREEEAALLALSALHNGKTLTEDELGLRQELTARLEVLTQDEVAGLVQWIRQARGQRTPFWRRLGWDPERPILLLLLLAHTLGADYRQRLILILRDLGLSADDSGLGELFSRVTARRSWFGGSGLKVEYVKLARELIFNARRPEYTPPELATPERFAGWSWIHQLVALLNWAEEWDRGRDPRASQRELSPLLYAHRIEYRLAACDAYARLAREGGLVARRVLSLLGYRDCARPARWPWLKVAAVLILCAASWAGVQVQRERVRQWHLENIELVREVAASGLVSPAASPPMHDASWSPNR
jgi:hypothetical protein